MGSRDRDRSASLPESYASSPRGKDNLTQEALMRSGGGLQGLMWSKYGLSQGKMSPLEKKRLKGRVNSEPLNDASKLAAANAQLRTGKERSMSEPGKPLDTGKPQIEIVNVLSNLKLDPQARLEEAGSSSTSPRSPTSATYAQIMRTDSFDVLLKNKVRKEFKGKEISYGKVVGQGLSQQTGKEDEVRK